MVGRLISKWLEILKFVMFDEPYQTVHYSCVSMATATYDTLWILRLFGINLITFHPKLIQFHTPSEFGSGCSEYDDGRWSVKKHFKGRGAEYTFFIYLFNYHTPHCRPKTNALCISIWVWHRANVILKYPSQGCTFKSMHFLNPQIIIWGWTKKFTSLD